MGRRNVATIIAGGVLAVLLLVYMSTYQVRFNQVAIVKTFGQITHVEWEPGLGLRWPWPIQQVEKFDRRVNLLVDPLSETLTRGGKPVVAQAYMAWRIKDPELFLKNVGTKGQATKQLRKLLKAQKEAVLGQYSLGNFVSSVPGEVRLAEVEEKLLKEMNDRGFSQYGVEVLAVGIKRLGVPGSTSEQIFAAMKQGREELATKYRSAGQAEAESIRSRAESIHDKILSFAQLRAEQLRAEGQAAAADMYKVFQADERFAIFLKALRVLEETLGSNTTIVMDWTQWPFDFFQKGPSLPASPVEGLQVGAVSPGAVSKKTAPSSQPVLDPPRPERKRSTDKPAK